VANSPFAYVRFRWLYPIGWAIWISTYAWVLHLYGWQEEAAAADSILTNGLLAAISTLSVTSLRYYLPSTNRYTYLAALIVLPGILWFVLCRSLLLLIPFHQADYDQFWSQSAPIRLAVGMLLLAFVTLMHVLWYTLQQHREDDKRKSELEQLAREAELYHLKEQLHPHFLFNSLNSINALIGSKPEAARSMIQELSDFLRGTLKHDHKQWQSLSEELQHLELYLGIEKVRFGHRLQTAVHCEEGLDEARIPAMLLQPVVENAIKFGLYDTTQPVLISIDAKMAGNQLVIEVTNPFDPETVSRKKGTGFGLRSVERRLHLLFAQPGLLTTRVQDNYFTTTLKIPQRV
jgi:signal transduction histidine kinase